MKKIVITLLLSCMALTGIRAQIGTDFGVNMFVTLNGGLSYSKDVNSEFKPGFAGGIGVGKWILTPLAGRVDLDFMTGPSMRLPEHTVSYAAATMEFLWDPMATFSRVRNWDFNIYPIIGLGIIYRAGDGKLATDRDVHSLLGVNANYRLGMGWDAYFEYKCFFLPESFDDGRTFLHTAVLGFPYR